MTTEILVLLCLCLINSKTFAQNREDPFSAEESTALRKLRPLVENSVHFDYQSKDPYLIGFLRAKNLNVEQAKEMVLKTMEWRKLNQVDTITSDKKMYELIKRFPISFGKAIDRKGRPALLPSFGSWDIRRAMIGGDKELLSKYSIFIYESIVSKARELGQSQWVFFIDMSGYNTRQHACLACVPFFLDLLIVYENYYPNTARHILFLNTPRVFESLLNVLKPLMSPTTKKDLKVYGYNKNEWRQEILKIFPPEQLTPKYGGIRKDPTFY